MDEDLSEGLRHRMYDIDGVKGRSYTRGGDVLEHIFFDEPGSRVGLEEVRTIDDARALEMAAVAITSPKQPAPPPKRGLLNKLLSSASSVGESKDETVIAWGENDEEMTLNDIEIDEPVPRSAGTKSEVPQLQKYEMIEDAILAETIRQEERQKARQRENAAQRVSLVTLHTFFFPLSPSLISITSLDLLTLSFPISCLFALKVLGEHESQQERSAMHKMVETCAPPGLVVPHAREVVAPMRDRRLRELEQDTRIHDERCRRG